MNLLSPGFRGTLFALAALARAASPATAQDRSEITIEDASAAPENLTSTQDGTVFFGSTAKGTIYRALPDKSQAVAWIPGDKAKLTNVLGLLADEKSNTPWVCDNAPFGRGTPPAGLPALRSFDLKTGEARGTFAAPGGGVCNDVAIASDGTAYTSDTFGGRVLRLKPGAKELEVWASGPELRGVDGLSFLADGSLYVNLIFNGKLLRIPVKEDGTAGPVAEIKTSVSFSRPDGLRTSGPKSLLQAEGGGRVTEITVEGDRAEVRVLKDGMSGSLGVTQVGKTAFVLAERRKAVAVPMTAESQGETPKKP
jgi:streptogramin lyase